MSILIRNDYQSIYTTENDRKFIFFMREGGLATGAYFKVGNMMSSNAGYPLDGTYKIISMSLTNESNVGSNTTIRLQRRTARTTFSDITGAQVVITSGTYRVKTSLNITLNADEELSAYNVSGSSLSNSVLIVEIQKIG
jgi:hypothetical protein